MVRKLAALAAFALVLAISTPALAAAGDRDHTFGGDGVATVSFNDAGGDGTQAVAVQGDGRIVVLGNANFDDGALIRFKPGGARDHTFSGDGTRKFPIGESQEGMGLALQPNGKILVVGRLTGSSPSDRDFFVKRFNVGGPLDTAFGGGTVTMDFDGGDDRAAAVAVQADGKIVVAGQAQIGSDFRPALARFTPSGAPDPAFGGGDGKVTTPVFDESGLAAIALQPDGKIVVVGTAGHDETSSDILVLRYRPNGTLDPTFSGDGKAFVNFLTSDAGEAVALAPNGAIVVAGEEFVSGSDANWVFARFHSNGTLDHTFNSDGKRVLVLGDQNDFVTGLVVQSTGKIVASGDSLDVSTFRAAMVRLKPGGTLDHSFSGDGKVLDDFGSEAFFLGLKKYPDDRLVAGISVRQSGNDFDLGAARYLAG